MFSAFKKWEGERFSDNQMRQEIKHNMFFQEEKSNY